MSGWGAGYVTDVTYIPGYYRQQSPAHLDMIARLSGIAFHLPEDFTWVELGCGVGFGAAIIAAANPRATVVGIDFNPAHIADARALAEEAGLPNLRFLEADLSTLADSAAVKDVPEADIVTMHGVWSWVPEAVQQGIVRLLAARVRPGGLVHVSYNALPTWQGGLAYQRLIREAGLRLAQRSDQQVQAGVEVMLALRDAKATHLSGELAVAMADKAPQMPIAYLAHEFMNASWRPCFFADVAAALAPAKLDFAGSALAIEQFPDLVMSEAQRAVYERFDDTAMRETVKDCCLGRALRQDVFVRGARRLDRAARDAALMDVSLGLVVTADEFAFEAEMPAGHASFSPDFYRPIAEALAARPRTVRELLAMPEAKGRKDNPAEIAGVLAGTDQAIPLLRPGAAQTPQAVALNAALARRVVNPSQLGRGYAMCSHAVGGGVGMAVPEMHIAQRLLAGEGREAIPAWTAALDPGGNEERTTEIAERLAEILDRRVPLWHALGVM